MGDQVHFEIIMKNISSHEAALQFEVIDAVPPPHAFLWSPPLTKMTNYEYLLLRRYQDGLSRNSYYRVSSVVMAEVLRIFND